MATWWRVVRWIPEAPIGAPGHPTFVSIAHQGSGRFDNPQHYTAGYVAKTPQGAVGEVYANNAVWTAAMLRVDRPAGATPALVAFDLGDPTLVNLDDADVLGRYDVRPSAVVRRNREATRELALRIFLAGGSDGLQWWSYHRPEWTVATIWRGHGTKGIPRTPFERARVDAVEPLSLDHPALVLAADVLRRVIEP